MKKTFAITLCVLTLITLLCACSKQEDNTIGEGDALDFLTEQLDVFKNADRESVENVIGANDTEAVFYENNDLSLYYKNFDYTIDSFKQDGDSASAVVTVQNIDFGSVFNDYIQKLFEFAAENSALDSTEYDTKLMEESGKIFSDLINNNDYELLKSTVTVKMTKKDGTWTIVNTEDFTAAILPGTEAGITSDTY